MKRAFVDTGAWFAFSVASDPDHAAVAGVIRPWEGRLVTSDYVFDELVTLLRFRAGHDHSVRIGQALRGGRIANIVALQPPDLDDAWDRFSRHADKAYSFTDCTSFALMTRLGIETALAVDAHFAQAGFDALPRTTE